MARRALAICVAVSDRESGVGQVIEPGGRAPSAGVVAVRAGGGGEDSGIEPGGVRWAGGVVVIVLVAADTCRRQRRVISVDVAVGALPGRHGVQASQRKSRVVVIESRVRPVCRVMTELTGRGESGDLMCRISRARVVLLMTRVAERAVQRIVVVDVAVAAGTRGDCVRSRQLEAGTVVVKRTIRPLVGVVAGLAGRW